MSTEFKGNQELQVYCGDTTLYFEKGRSYRWSYLRQVFRERIQRCPSCSHPYELFPGAIFTDAAGRKWKVQLQAVVVPAEPEEDDVREPGV